MDIKELEELEKLKSLKDKGILTEKEFTDEKQRILGLGEKKSPQKNKRNNKNKPQEPSSSDINTSYKADKTENEEEENSTKSLVTTLSVIAFCIGIVLVAFGLLLPRVISGFDENLQANFLVIGGLSLIFSIITIIITWAVSKFIKTSEKLFKQTERSANENPLPYLLGGVVFTIFIIIIGRNNNGLSFSNSAYKNLCVSEMEKSAIYGYKNSYAKEICSNSTVGYYVIGGKLQNAFGTWRDITHLCMVVDMDGIKMPMLLEGQGDVILKLPSAQREKMCEEAAKKSSSDK